MTLSLNIGNLFNDSSSHALVDELRKRTSEEEILDFEEKFNSKNEKNLHIYICRFLKNRSISRGLASKWLETIITDTINELKSNSFLEVQELERIVTPNNEKRVDHVFVKRRKICKRNPEGFVTVETSMFDIPWDKK